MWSVECVECGVWSAAINGVGTWGRGGDVGT